MHLVEVHYTEKWKNMGFKINLIIRVSLVFLLGFGAMYIAVFTPFWLVSAWLILFTVLSLIVLISFLEKDRRELSSFLTAIQQNDFTNNYPSSNKKKNDLYHAFNVISSEFRKVRSQKESNFHFLQAIVEHTEVPLICFGIHDKKITLMNEAAKALFQKPFFNSLDSLKGVNKKLPQLLLNLSSGQKELHTININNQAIPLSIIAKELVLETERFKLIAFHNIKNELEEKELESWQKLIKVLTHEIKNSAIPISTLSSVISQMIIDDHGALKDISQLAPEDADDLKNGLNTVEKRSKGLASFISAYGQLSRLPEPNLQTIHLTELFKSVESLLSNSLREHKISLYVEVAENITINADSGLIEQVLINLVKNAIEVLPESSSSKIALRGSQSNFKTIIQVSDNGVGIDQESLENIFVPFYTTKKEGSGIGLSLSKQIMKSHGGSIYAHSEIGVGTTFYLEF